MEIYNGYGQIIRRDTGSLIEEFEYDTNFNLMSSYSNSKGVFWTKTFDVRTAALVSYKDSTGKDELYEYNHNNQLVNYLSLSDGVWFSKEYNKMGNCIGYKDSFGKEIKRRYDDNGRLIYLYKHDDAEEWNISEQWWEYDERGNMIYYQNSDWYSKYTQYNEFNLPIHTADSYGFESWHEYDEEGKKTYYTDTENYTIEYEYDENGILIV